MLLIIGGIYNCIIGYYGAIVAILLNLFYISTLLSDDLSLKTFGFWVHACCSCLGGLIIIIVIVVLATAAQTAAQTAQTAQTASTSRSSFSSQKPSTAVDPNTIIALNALMTIIIVVSIIYMVFTGIAVGFYHKHVQAFKALDEMDFDERYKDMEEEVDEVDESTRKSIYYYQHTPVEEIN